MTVVQKTEPELRFPGFGGEWEVGRLKNLVDSLDAGISVNSGDRPTFLDEKGILKTSCVTSGKFNFQENKAVLEAHEVSRLKEAVLNNTVIISRMNTPALVGANSYIDQDYPNLFLPDRLWSAKINIEHVARWVGLLISTIKIRAIFSSRATGTSGSMKNITKGDVLTVPVSFPNKIEQQKIASFLTSVDDKLTKLRRKCELLDTYKCGLMQQLFSQMIRFKQDDGEEFPEWDKCKLGGVATFLKGKGISKSDIAENGKTSCIRYGELYTKYKEKISNVISKTNLLEIDLVFSEALDVIIPSSGETHIDIATASCVMESGIALSGDLTIIRGDFSGVFFAYYLNSHQKIEIAKLAQGNSVVHLYSSQLAKLTIQLPCLKEQQKIADCLSSFDAKIEAVAKQIQQLESFKKGLLQKMFV